MTPPRSPAPPPTLFRSFWSGGYESSMYIDNQGRRIDMIAAVQHDLMADQDYRLLRSVGMKTARDAVRWHLVDRGGGHYDFSSFQPMLQAAIRNGIQVIWDLCHYGYPQDLDIFSAAFVDRFAKFCGAVARLIREHTDDIPFYSPVNEISFFCWGAARDFIYPFAWGRDNEIKAQLVRAAIAAVEAVRDVDPRARVTYPEPSIHVRAPRHRPELAAQAEHHRMSQFEAWDMIAGLRNPELGGKMKYLDILGSNFYFNSEWEVEGDGCFAWHPKDDRWRPYHLLLTEIWQRYRRPLYVAETSHFGSGRAHWVREITKEIVIARTAGIPVEGVCLYPILDRASWHNHQEWHNSGLFDYKDYSSLPLERVLNPEYGAALRECQGTIYDIVNV